MKKITSNLYVSTPEISVVDTSGVQWGFDPSSQRWNAQTAGKKLSSKDFSVLSAKVQALLPSANPADDLKKKKLPVSSEPVVATLVCIQFSNTNGILFSPIVAKIQWNAATGLHSIESHKHIEGGKETSWRHYRSGNPVFHPMFLAEDTRQKFVQAREVAMVNALLESSQHEILNAWWKNKAPCVNTWDLSREAEIIQVKFEKDTQMSKSRTAKTSPNWQILDAPQEMSPPWETQPDGSCRAGSVSVHMLPPAGISVLSPGFEVRDDAWPSPLFSGPFEQAMLLAAATYRISLNRLAPVLEWHAKFDWEHEKHINAPNLYEVHAAALVLEQQSSRYIGQKIQTFTLSRLIDNGSVAKRKNFGSSAKDDDVVKWRVSEASVFALAGPEDAILESIPYLKNEVSVAFEKMNLLFETNPLTLNRLGDVSFNEDALRVSCEDTLSKVAGVLEEDPGSLTQDITGLSKQIAMLSAKVDLQAQTSTPFTDFSSTCSQTVERARSPLSPPRSSRSPSP